MQKPKKYPRTFDTSNLDDAQKKRLTDFYDRRRQFDIFLTKHRIQLYTCPCCGYPTLIERGGYIICKLCDWEDDYQDDADADYIKGGPNYQYSLTETRLNFALHLIKYDPENPHKRASQRPNTPLAHQHKQEIMTLLNRMLKTGKKEEINQLWQQIRDHREILDAEVRSRIGGLSPEKLKKLH